jgi:hypothetical protein
VLPHIRQIPWKQGRYGLKNLSTNWIFSERMADLIRKEKITAFAVIPMIPRGEIVGSLNFASHTRMRFPRMYETFLRAYPCR